MTQKRLALNADGEMTYCSASEENIGKGRCNHVAHQKDGESQIDFMNRANEETNQYSNNEDQIIKNREKLLEKANQYKDKKNPLLASYDESTNRYNVGGYINPILTTDDFENYEVSGVQTASVGLLDNEYQELHDDKESIKIIENYDLNSNKVKMIKEFKMPLLPDLDNSNQDGNYILELVPDVDKLSDTVPYKDGKFEERLKDLAEELKQDNESGLSYEELRDITEQDIYKYSENSLNKLQENYNELLSKAEDSNDQSLIENYKFRNEQIKNIKEDIKNKNVSYSDQIALKLLAVESIDKEIEENSSDQSLRITRNKMNRFI